MKRLLSVLFLLAFAACVNHPSQTPNVGDSNAETQNGFDESPEQPQAANDWRYAQPPPGVQGAPHDLGRDADTRSAPPKPRTETRPSAQANKGAFDEAPRTSAPEPKKDGYANESEARGRSADKAEALGSSGAVARKSPAQPTEDRPGLGTTWGETRYSSVSEVHFERDGESPSYTASLNYNDSRGASAMAGYASYSRNASVGLGSALSMSLRDEYGNSLAAYRGNGRTVAVGENGQRYTIVIDNNTNERFEVVLSVDGLDVLDGREASFGKRGYMIEAYGHLEVEGFRQSDEAVAAFRFGSVRDSYAARTGQARNVGVIGAAAFGERGYRARLAAYQERLRYNSGDVERRRNADPFPGRYATPPQWTVVR